MKGVHPILSHSILMLLGLTAMGLMLLSITVSLSKTEEALVSSELNFLANSVKSRILEAYSLASQSSNYTSGLFELDVPEKIGNRRYSITLIDNALLANTSVRSHPIEVALSVPIEAEMNGTSFMPASISVEKQNGAIRIGLIK